MTANHPKGSILLCFIYYAVTYFFINKNIVDISSIPPYIILSQNRKFFKDERHIT